MNVNPEGKQSHICSTHFRPNNIYQSIVFSADHSKYSNQPKGM